MRRRTSVGAIATAAVALALGAFPQSARPGIPWCGPTAGGPTDLSPDGNGFEWHAVYAHASDRPNRFAEWAPRIAGDVAAIDAWWRGQDARRRPRWDFEATFGCGSEFGRLDISSVSLPRESTYYADGGLVAGHVAAHGAPLFHADKAFLIYLDGGGSFRLCGQATLPDEAGPHAHAVLFLDACDAAQADGSRAATAAHEMVHAMGGGLAGQLPNACPESHAHVCDSATDILWPVNQRLGLDAYALDVGRNDYYGHARASWDVDESLLLHRLDAVDQAPPTPPRNLTATSNGTEVWLTWGHAVDAVGPIWYRIYDGSGFHLETHSAFNLVTSAGIGDVVAYRLRAMDAVGFLSPTVSIRFRVGYGIVDGQNRVVKDTVAPSAVTGLRARRVGARAVLRWRPATDLVGVRGYRLTLGGVQVAFVRDVTASLPYAQARGRLVTVEAIDLSGNAGRAAGRIVPRR